MSLATRCPACATVFRVVQDQLKVSDGWVRCGRCNEVFDASADLIVMDDAASGFGALSGYAPDAADADTLASGRPAQAADATEASPEYAERTVATGTRDAAAAAAPAQAMDAQADEGARAKPSPAAWADDLPHADVPANATEQTVVLPVDELTSYSPADGKAPGPGPAPLDIDLSQPWAGTTHELDAPPIAGEVHIPGSVPEFVRQADRAARWNSTGMRVFLWFLALALALLLGGQIALAQRDVLAANFKETRPWLEWTCQHMGCQIQPLRRIELLSVEGTALARMEGSPLYKISMVLHSRAETEVLMPAIDLALTDAEGQVIARRVLQVAEMGNPAQVLAPRAEVPLQAMLSTGSRRVAGYTIEVFYP